MKQRGHPNPFADVRTVIGDRQHEIHAGSFDRSSNAFDGSAHLARSVLRLRRWRQNHLHDAGIPDRMAERGRILQVAHSDLAPDRFQCARLRRVSQDCPDGNACFTQCLTMLSSRPFRRRRQWQTWFVSLLMRRKDRRAAQQCVAQIQPGLLQIRPGFSGLTNDAHLA